MTIYSFLRFFLIIIPKDLYTCIHNIQYIQYLPGDEKLWKNM